MPFRSNHSSSNRVFDFICLWVLPIGFFFLLAGLYFLPDRSAHQRLFYTLISVPTLIALCIRPYELKFVMRSQVLQAFVVFAVWSLVTLALTPHDDGIRGPVVRSLHVVMLFAGTCMLLRHRGELVKPVFLGAAIVAVLASLYNLVHFAATYTPGDRMIGAGAFDNPLLSSHLFGFFCVYWLYLAITTTRNKWQLAIIPGLLIMLAAVLATGSRTPLVALAMAAVWLALMCWNLRSILLLVLIGAVGLGVMVLLPDVILGRGDSFRLEIWHIVLGLIGQAPWIGHGLEAELSIDPGTGFALSEPHNFALGVLYYVGIIGFVPWLFMQLRALFEAWQQRQEGLMILASTLLVYGIGAGLTEGGGVISRPKEHWFLLWIPLALVAAVALARQTKRLSGIMFERLDQAQLQALMAGGKVIEQDGSGPKVVILGDGTFLKLFRKRRWYTSGSVMPYAQRFAENSIRLAYDGVATPPILNLYSLPDGETGVRYEPLPGQTLRQALQGAADESSRALLVERFGEYLATLHERGIYFRSLHLGNVLVMDSDEFGLIDLADMRVLPSALSMELRRRNLRHMRRYKEDRAWLFEDHLDRLLKGYAALASAKAVKNMEKQVQVLASAS